MKYVIGLSGTHCTGKTTLLNELEKSGFNVDGSHIFRDVQKSLGWKTLSEIETSPEKMWQLQNAGLDAIIKRDELITNSKIVTVVDRTPADTWAYTQMWCRRFNIDASSDECAIAYSERCFEASKLYSTIIFVPIIDSIQFKEESNRADLSSRQDVDEFIRAFLQQMSNQFYYLQSTAINHRVDEIIDEFLANEITSDLMEIRK